MRCSKFGAVAFVRVAAIAAVLAVALTLQSSPQAAAATDDESVQPLKDKQLVPTLIDWNSYTKMFNKEYPSLRQQLVRQQIFMANAMAVVKTSIKYRLSLLPYFSTVNQYSDLTPQEEVRMMSGDDADYESDFDDDDEAERKLSQQDDFGASQSAAASRRSARRKRSLVGTLTRSLSFRELIRKPLDVAAATATAAAHQLQPRNLKWIVPSNNPEYLPIEQTSLGLGDEQQQQVDEIPEGELSRVEQEASKSLATLARESQWGRALGWMSGQASGADKTAATKPAAERRQNDADVVQLDWRKTGCVRTPIDQGKCDSCYAITSMAFVEWAFCMNQERVLTPLSVQYMVSCGPQFRRETGDEMRFFGCKRGYSKHAMYFVQNYGVELEAHMPYLAQETSCPVEEFAETKRRGYIRPNIDDPVKLSPKTKQLDLALKKGPVIVSFRIPVDFLAYGGGIVERCKPTGSHAMLIVGKGIENGIEYLLIKNSFGPNWGMDGYFKFNRNSIEECVNGFIAPRVKFPSRKAQTRRIKAYLAAHQSPKDQASSATTSFDEDERFNVADSNMFIN